MGEEELHKMNLRERKSDQEMTKLFYFLFFSLLIYLFDLIVLTDIKSIEHMVLGSM
jgi:hypothetical protein